MAELKTKKTTASVDAFLDSITNPTTQADCRQLCSLMQRLTAKEPKLWGSAIVGFGDYRYRYASGREGDWFIMGFSPRSTSISIYATVAVEQHAKLLTSLGRYKAGVGCLYIKRLADINISVLEAYLLAARKQMAESTINAQNQTDSGAKTGRSKTSLKTTPKKQSRDSSKPTVKAKVRVTSKATAHSKAIAQTKSGSNAGSTSKTKTKIKTTLKP